MTTSAAGIAALQLREGVELTMYRDSAGLPTIGVGHLLTRDELSSGKIVLPVDWHPGITGAQAEALLRRDLAVAEAAVTSTVHVPLAAHQFDALVSFTFNVGGQAFRDSTLVRLLNAGDYGSVPAQLRRWVYAGGQQVRGLINRRAQEAQQWAGG